MTLITETLNRRRLFNQLLSVTSYIREQLVSSETFITYRSSPPIEGGRQYFWELVSWDDEIARKTYIKHTWECDRKDRMILSLLYMNERLVALALGPAQGPSQGPAQGPAQGIKSWFGF